MWTHVRSSRPVPDDARLWVVVVEGDVVGHEHDHVRVGNAVRVNNLTGKRFVTTLRRFTNVSNLVGVTDVGLVSVVGVTVRPGGQDHPDLPGVLGLVAQDPVQVLQVIGYVLG